MLPDVANLEEYGLTERERKAKHRKMHGKIGFAELARNIANKWNNMNDAEKAAFEACARTEKEKYQEEIDKWKTTDGYVQKRRKRSRKNQVTKTCPQDFPCKVFIKWYLNIRVSKCSFISERCKLKSISSVHAGVETKIRFRINWHSKW